MKATYQRIDLQPIVDCIRRLAPEATIIRQNEGCHKERITVELNRPIKIMGDDCRPRILITTAHNGSEALRIKIGLFRVVCTNGLVFGEVTDYRRVIHRVGPKSAEFQRTYEYQIAAVLADIDQRLTNRAAQLAQTLTTEVALAKIVSLKMPKAIEELAVETLHYPRRVEDEGNTVWTLLNIVNEANAKASRRLNAESGLSAAAEWRNDHLLDRLLAT